MTFTPNQEDPPVRTLLKILLAIGGAGALLMWFMRRQKNTPAAYPTAQDLITEPLVDARVVRHRDGALMVRWYRSAETIIVYGGTSPAAINTDEPMAVTSDVSSVTFGKLDPTKRHYFRVQFIGGPHDGETLTVAERNLPLTGGVNFRDIGGYRTTDGRYTAWGKVYRAGGLDALTDADRTLLTNMGLQTACDLRTTEETDEFPDNLPDTTEYVALPVQMRSTRSQQVRDLMKYRTRMEAAMVEAYTRLIIDGNPDVFGGVVAQVADESKLPLVIHCTAGKDRTGVAVALLLALVGVPDETILADYSLSNAHFDVFLATGTHAIEPLRHFGITPESIQPFFTANPATMAAALAHIRERYGSVEGYLTTAGGVTPQQIERVRALLIS